MNSKARLYMLMIMGGMFPSSMYSSFDNKKELNPIDIKELKERAIRLRENQLLQKGCKEFQYNEVTIIAFNKKNADRKYFKYLKLKSEFNKL